MIVYIIIFIIILVAIIILHRLYSKKAIHDHNKYSELTYLVNNLNNNLSVIQKESINVLNNKPKLLERRKEGEWSGNKGDKYAEKLKDKDGWIYGWTEDDNWLNYPIMYDGKLFSYAKKSLPNLCKYIKDISHCIHVAGLSVLKPNGRIKEHTDDEQTYDKGTLNFHYNIYATGNPTKGQSIITINNDKIIQKTGNALLFDAGNLHSVHNNSSDYRIILFIDFRHINSRS